MQCRVHTEAAGGACGVSAHSQSYGTVTTDTLQCIVQPHIQGGIMFEASEAYEETIGPVEPTLGAIIVISEAPGDSRCRFQSERHARH